MVAASLDSHVASVTAVARGRTKHGVSSVVLQETVEYLTSTCKPKLVKRNEDAGLHPLNGGFDLR